MTYKNLFLILFIAITYFSCGKKNQISPEKKENQVKQYKLVWSDEFNGNKVNKENWSFVLWKAGKVNNEWQKYVENIENYKVENRILSISATRTGKNECR